MNAIPLLITFHVFSVLLLTGFTFFACAAPKPEQRKRMLMLTGLLSLAVVLTGFAMLGMEQAGFPGWAAVKVVCWVGISAVSGIVYRKPQRASGLLWLTSILLLIALFMVFFRPL